MAERPERSHLFDGSPPLFFLGHFLALFAGLGETDGDSLLPAFHLAAFSALAALRFSSLVAVHLALHFGAGAARIFPFPLLGHKSSSTIDAIKTRASHPAGNVRSKARVPSSIVEQPSADDKLITLGYTFKLLTDEQ